MIRRHRDFTWEDVPIHPYKEDGTVFRGVTRQTLFEAAHDLPVQLRYFEVGEDGYSTLERHQHAHLVVVIRGSGQVLVGDEVGEVGLHDVVHVPPMTWHQFRSNPGERLGFLCVVNCERDRPQRPTEEELSELRRCAEVADFIRV